MFKVPEKYRLKVGKYATKKEDGNNGIFIIPLSTQIKLNAHCLVAFGGGWEMVSVTIESMGVQRAPKWSEMDKIKNIFWDEDDVVMQFHLPKSQKPLTYHTRLIMWRPIGVNVEAPDNLSYLINGIEES